MLREKTRPEPVFADLLGRPGIDFQPGGPVRQLYFSYRPVRAGIFKPLWSPGIDAKASIPPAYVAWRAGTITLFLLGA